MTTTVIGIDPSFCACGVSDGAQHIIVATHVRADEPAAEATTRRALEIVKATAEFIGQRTVHVYIESAMNTSRDAMHLYEIGWLMNDLHKILPQVVAAGGGRVLSVNEVPIATLRTWATGKGNAPKDVMKLAVYKKFGIEFERDRGCDKLFAYLLSRYGVGVLLGEVMPVVKKRRGEGKRARQIANKNRSAA